MTYHTEGSPVTFFRMVSTFSRGEDYGGLIGERLFKVNMPSEKRKNCSLMRKRGKPDDGKFILYCREGINLYRKGIKAANPVKSGCMTW